MASEEIKHQGDEPWFLKSHFPVLVPSHPALLLAREEFDDFVCKDVAAPERSDENEKEDDTDLTVVNTPPSTTAEVRKALGDVTLNTLDHDIEMSTDGDDTKKQTEPQHPFIKGLVSAKADVQAPMLDTENKMLTENADVAFRSTLDPLLDLFSELEDVIAPNLLRERLDAAWACDELATLKIIFNARSIHLGKSSKSVFYRAAGWLYKNHPATLVANLRWLSRPVIEKKVEQKKEGTEEEAVMVEAAELDENDPRHYDVRNGVAHGYWKDLLNILALAVNDVFNETNDYQNILNCDQRMDKAISGLDKDLGKVRRREIRTKRHEAATHHFENIAAYRALHLAVARLFAEQLQRDLAAMRGDDAQAKKNISLCAKWAPSAERFHDKHTFVVSSIAEIMHPASSFDTADRDTYLRYAREAYRKDVSKLREHLDIVERKITANKLDEIKYDRIPSVAMHNYSPVFAKKDTERFEKYIENVASGKVNISGATLLPSKLVSLVRNPHRQAGGPRKGGKGSTENKLLAGKMLELQLKVADAQWNALVQRIKDSGTLENCIAVCDVSGSMGAPVFRDGTCPMDSAIGLSLLMAEVTGAPFGGHFITFSADPEVQSVDLEASLSEKVTEIMRAPWGMNTDFVAVFEDLILPMAQRNKLRQDEMVKRVFVFSDMQFDEASMRKRNGRGGDRWSTSYERIESAFKDAGYEMPEMVFWNLAGGRAGGGGGGGGDPTAPKPVTMEQPGTAMVSGYSQAMLKVFLDNGSFEDAEEDEDEAVVVEEGEDGDEEAVVQVRKKARLDPVSIMKKAIGHKAYAMLKVVD
ncbi:uncharacterized protein E0L32_002871 [Thyridium curvatum]|uniref:Uncharacterized protein n=1 Tax=Thyridium curvatum TaxID=1093900 RepID=A0A507BM31_9PEZI|nr:uncharacterized protein E0L32_002871 [Thyridium curvatum]TPX17770.1 hypothetical protein E0L32_002871 [Thyridium curvatum]